jgi:hypothetical protein
VSRIFADKYPDPASSAIRERNNNAQLEYESVPPYKRSYRSGGFKAQVLSTDYIFLHLLSYVEKSSLKYL